MKDATFLWILTAVLLALNFADFISTWIAIDAAKGAEANPFILMLGGPFSPPVIFVKLVLIPVAILSVVWWVTRYMNARIGVAALIPAAATLAGIVANNVIVIAKKVKKTTKKVKKVAN